MIYQDYHITDYNLETTENINISRENTTLNFRKIAPEPYFKALFSSADTNYMPREIQYVTATELDDKQFKSGKSDGEFATVIAQLLIDINNYDAIDLKNWVLENKKIAPPEDVISTRVKRFNKAFSYIFDDLMFKTTATFEGKQQVIFNNRGKEVTLPQLSSGERHVIFRGAFFLKNQKYTDDYIILIDEPELSLHPDWQKKILDYYKQLFTDSEGKQTSQIFVATHSPFIIHGENRYNDKVIILSRKDDCVIQVDDLSFPSVGDDERIYKALNVKGLFANSNQIPTVYVEGKTDVKYWNKAKELFSARADKYTFEAIGEEDNKGGKGGGDTFLTNGYKHLSIKQPPSPVIFLFDCDSKSYRDEKKGHVFKIKLKNTKSTITAGIENLLNLDTIDIIYIDKCYTTKDEETDMGNGRCKIVQIPTLDKVKLCDLLIKDDNVIDILSNFEKYILEFEEILLGKGSN